MKTNPLKPNRYASQVVVVREQEIEVPNKLYLNDDMRFIFGLFHPPSEVLGPVKLTQAELVKKLGAITTQVLRGLWWARDEHAWDNRVQSDPQQARMCKATWGIIQSAIVADRSKGSRLVPPLKQFTQKTIENSLARLAKLGFVRRVRAEQSQEKGASPDGWIVWREVVGGVVLTSEGHQVRLPRNVHQAVAKLSTRGGSRKNEESKKKMAESSRLYWERVRSGEVAKPNHASRRRIEEVPTMTVAQPATLAKNEKKENNANSTKTVAAPDALGEVPTSGVFAQGFDASKTAKKSRYNESPKLVDRIPKTSDSFNCTLTLDLSSLLRKEDVQDRVPAREKISTPKQQQSRQQTQQANDDLASTLASPIASATRGRRTSEPINAAYLPGVPRFVSLRSAQAMLSVPAAPLLNPTEPIEVRTMKTFQWFVNGIQAYGLRWPSVAGRFGAALSKGTKTWKIFAKAAQAFTDREIPPAAWFAYWFDKHLQHCRDTNTDSTINAIEFLAEQTILRPLGWHARISGFCFDRLEATEAGKAFLNNQARMHAALRVAVSEGCCSEELFRDICALFFPDTVERELERVKIEAMQKSQALFELAKNGGWVWEVSQ